jgi:uncharacterized membrane protein YraQ (UPF0718 family)
MTYIYILASAGLIISVISDRRKTVKALKNALNMFLKMLPLLFITLALVSIVLYFLPDHVIADYLSGSDLFAGTAAAALIGSISLLPGFITFPLAGLLLEQGVSYTIIAAFTVCLMMVGIVTYPIERKYFGMKSSTSFHINFWVDCCRFFHSTRRRRCEYLDI